MIYTKGMGGRLPYAVDVSCNHGKIDDLVPSFNFMVILNHYVYGFTEVNGIDKDIDYESIKEGGNPYPVFAHKNECSFEILNFKKGMPIRNGTAFSKAIKLAHAAAALIGNNLLRRAALIASSSLDPITTLEDGPAFGYLQVFDRAYKTDLATFSFFSYGASKWDLTDLDSTNGGVMYETISLVCSDLRRISTDYKKQSGLWNIIGEDKNPYQTYTWDTDKAKSNEEMEEMEKNREKWSPTKSDDDLSEKMRKADEENKKNREEWESLEKEADENWENNSSGEEQAKQIAENEKKNRATRVKDFIAKKKKMAEELEKLKEAERSKQVENFDEIEKQKKDNFEKEDK